MDIKEMTSKASEELDRGQKRVEDLSRTAGEVLNGAGQGTASALEDAASSVRTAGASVAEATKNLSAKTADKLDSAAASLRTDGVRGMLLGMRQVIGRHPTTFVFLAAGLGFVVGSAFRVKNASSESPVHPSRTNRERGKHATESDSASGATDHAPTE